jgi:predicted membrane GTPase involved in stress response
LFGFFGLKRIEVNEAKAGDLIAVSGMEDIFVGETVTPTDQQDRLPVLRIDAPTLQMTFAVNNSPFAGREGKFVTARKLEDRLKAQLRTDVSLRVDDTDLPGAWVVSGRGELHLSILVEELRREGFELQCFLVQKLSIAKSMANLANHLKVFKLIHLMNMLVLLLTQWLNVKVTCKTWNQLAMVKHG